MTISIARTNSTDAASAYSSRRVAPADVWDVDRRVPARRNVASVRTLEGSSRKYEPAARAYVRDEIQPDSVIEPRREKSGAVIMGALFGLALIVGSAFGGAFSGGDAGFNPDQMGNTIAAVAQP